MSALQRTRLGMSRRDIGAGLVGGVAALLANALFQLFWVVQLLVANPAAVLTDPEILWSAVQWDTITVAALTITPVVALVAGTVVWRAGMPEEPTPRLGAVAGVGTAFLSLLGFALAFGVFSALSDLSRGALFEAVDVFLIRLRRDETRRLPV